MRVAFNASSLLLPLTGIGQYSRHLAEGLAIHSQMRADFFYGTYWADSVREQPVLGADKLTSWIRDHIPYAYEIRRAIQAYRFGTHTRRKQFDIYHEPNTLPLPFDGPTVITVHDLTWIRYPDTQPLKRVRDLTKHFEAALHRANLIITVSEFVKRELISEFGTQPSKIVPIPLGVESFFRPRNASETNTSMARHGLSHGKYVLALGTLEPRKNVGLVIDSYRRLPNDIRRRYPLVLVGMKGWLASGFERKLAALIQAGEAKHLGYLDRGELSHIVAGAACLVYPSLYEGFGLPPLEAMASGIPVIASNAGSLPEVIGDAGILIDPLDADLAAHSIRLVIEDKELSGYISTKALERSAKFSWSHCVEKTLMAYGNIQ